MTPSCPPRHPLSRTRRPGPAALPALLLGALLALAGCASAPESSSADAHVSAALARQQTATLPEDRPGTEACDEPQAQSAGRPAARRSGRQGRPSAYEPFQQRGIASWYGQQHHGRPTASGEPFDMFGLSAAHPTLPLHSQVRVRHVASGKEVVVRINDRGPFTGNRIIDLSYAAAQKLGLVRRGKGEVEIERLPEGAARGGEWQLGDSGNKATAER